MKDLFKEFGLDDSGEEMNIGILDSKEKKYPLEDFGSWDEDEIKEFLTKFNKGKNKLWEKIFENKLGLFFKNPIVKILKLDKNI